MNYTDYGFELIKKLDQLIERWKKIEGYENYSVSTFGRIRNDKTKRILKPKISTNKYYCVGLHKNGIIKKINIHRLVGKAFLNNPQNKPYVDHVDRNKLNNHFNNLRYATSSENNRNRSKHKNNKSGYTGVTFDKSRNRFVATIFLNGRNKNIGRFKTAKEASNAYQLKIKEHFGEFANI